MIYQITDIAYDLDDDNYDDEPAPELPVTLTVSIPDHIAELCGIDELLSDYISETTGFCHNGFNFHQVD